MNSKSQALNFFFFYFLKIFIQVGRNICHGSDSVESANHEIGLWFTPAELQDWTQAMNSWINEGN